MREGTVQVVNGLGLHARAAAQIVKTAQSYRSSIILNNPELDVSADAKSILNLLTLSAAPGTQLSIRTDGEDEDRAFEAVSALIEGGFGEL